MHHEPARAKHEQSDGAQTTVTKVTGKVDTVSGWTRRLTAELESVCLTASSAIPCARAASLAFAPVQPWSTYANVTL
jgi:hypothetical protein